MPRSREDDRWIRRFHPDGPGDVQLVCFPHAGGSASYYFPMSKAMPPEIDALVLQYPGRQDRRHEPPVDSVPRLADQIFAVLADRLSPRFAFFGHSMGAVVAFEVARRFAAERGTAPLWFFASGRRAPSRRRAGTVHTMDDAELIAELGRVGGTDARLLRDEELLASILPAVRNDYRAIERYAWTPGPPVDCPVTVLVGESDPQTTVDEAIAWQEHFTGTCDLRVFPGGHFYLEDASAEVIDTVVGTLGAARALGGSRA
ncbi:MULTISPECIES: thioesterase II family protein [Actinomadura]|uniref:Thioesterase n=2 Tax=Actinomadura TaxID=1988 RepID=A0A5D0UK31_9ACTN|nr:MULTISPECIES: alpha/beta fold hydrolase [Actinomadura]TYC17499.1 thioesterase [Actinomadura syzygii]TYK52753.1 thioesterase [Actinomadura decatromicini]